MGKQIEEANIYIKSLNMDTGATTIICKYESLLKARKVIEFARKQRKLGDPIVWGIIEEY